MFFPALVFDIGSQVQQYNPPPSAMRSVCCWWGARGKGFDGRRTTLAYIFRVPNVFPRTGLRYRWFRSIVSQILLCEHLTLTFFSIRPRGIQVSSRQRY